MTHKNFLKGMALFLTVARNFKADTKTQGIYYSLLKDMSDEDFEFAIKSILNKTVDIFPTTNFVALVRDQLSKNEPDKALLAWGLALGAIKRHGGWYSVEFADPIIHSAVNLMGGWVTFGQFDEKDTNWKRKEFCEAYRSVSSRTEHPKYLKGSTETTNESIEGEVKVDKPILIGERANKQLTAINLI